MRSIDCTDQLPTKPKLLPRPCPICKRVNGTIQLVIFHTRSRSWGQTVCRIGHYHHKKYEDTKIKLDEIRNLKLQRKKRRSGGRIWHPFRIGYLLYEEDFEEYYIVMKYNHNKKIVTLTPNSQFIETIKKYGWDRYGELTNLTRRSTGDRQYK